MKNYEFCRQSLSKNICKIRAKIPSHWNQLSGADFMPKSSMEECD
jgi:hypothetical protein